MFISIILANLMHRSNPSMRSLEAFYAVVTLGSLAAAAEHLFVTQPAVSHLLRALEKSTGLVLFMKHGRRLELSEDGKLFFNEVANGIHVLGELRNSAEAIRSAKRGHIRIVAIPVAADHLLPEFLGAFSERNPGVRITLEVAEKHRALIMLESGAVELALVAQNSSPNFRTHCELKSHAVLIAPQDWKPTNGAAVNAGSGKRDAGGMPKIRLAAIGDEPFVALNTGSPFRQLLDSYMQSSGLSLSIRVQTRTQSTLAALVATGAGVGLIDEIVAHKLAPSVNIYRTDADLAWTFQLLSRSGGTLSTAAASFADYLSNALMKGRQP